MLVFCLLYWSTLYYYYHERELYNFNERKQKYMEYLVINKIDVILFCFVSCYKGIVKVHEIFVETMLGKYRCLNLNRKDIPRGLF